MTVGVGVGSSSALFGGRPRFLFTLAGLDRISPTAAALRPELESRPMLLARMGALPFPFPLSPRGERGLEGDRGGFVNELRGFFGGDAFGKAGVGDNSELFRGRPGLRFRDAGSSDTSIDFGDENTSGM